MAAKEVSVSTTHNMENNYIVTTLLLILKHNLQNKRLIFHHTRILQIKVNIATALLDHIQPPGRKEVFGDHGENVLDGYLAKVSKQK